MTLSSYRMHRIYLAATMGYGLGSDDPEELAYYKKLRKETYMQLSCGATSH